MVFAGDHDKFDQKIIAIGPDVISLILAELRERPDHWFWALHVLADADPVPASDTGHFQKMAAAWITWGEDNGFILPENPRRVSKTNSVK
jgi:hypothetical protein